MIDLRKNKSEKIVHITTDPSPIAVQGDGRKCWQIKSIKDDCVYKIWAQSYKEALEMLPMIESF